MSDELNAEITRLKAENAKLSTDLATLTKDHASLGEELKDTRHEARDRRHEAKTLAATLEATAKERDDFKGKAEADPDNLRKQVADAQSVVRGLKHERAFEKVARTLKVSDPAKFQDLVALAKYTPEGDEPDEARISATFAEALKGRAWLVDAPAAAAATTVPGGANGATANGTGGKPGPGADRGQSVSTESSSAASKPERVTGRL